MFLCLFIFISLDIMTPRLSFVTIRFIIARAGNKS